MLPSNLPWHRQLPFADVRTLNKKQRKAYDIILDHYTELTSGKYPEPLLMIISRTAGTGKSYLTNAISGLLKNTCVLTGTTGMASFNIGGKTLHSALNLPIQRSSHHDLQGTHLKGFS